MGIIIGILIVIAVLCILIGGSFFIGEDELSGMFIMVFGIIIFLLAMHFFYLKKSKEYDDFINDRNIPKVFFEKKSKVEKLKNEIIALRKNEIIKVFPIERVEIKTYNKLDANTGEDVAEGVPYEYIYYYKNEKKLEKYTVPAKDIEVKIKDNTKETTINGSSSIFSFKLIKHNLMEAEKNITTIYQIVPYIEIKESFENCEMFNKEINYIKLNNLPAIIFINREEIDETTRKRIINLYTEIKNEIEKANKKNDYYLKERFQILWCDFLSNLYSEEYKKLSISFLDITPYSESEFRFKEHPFYLENYETNSIFLYFPELWEVNIKDSKYFIKKIKK